MTSRRSPSVSRPASMSRTPMYSTLAIPRPVSDASAMP